MTPRLSNLRRRLSAMLKVRDADKDLLDLIKEIEKETDMLLAAMILSR